MDVPQNGGSAWTAAQVASVARRIDAAIGATPLDGTHLGVVAIDTQRGRLLYARNAADAFVPGSTIKLVTGIVALDRLGPSWRFQTRLVARGGGLVLVGGGDPQLSQRDLLDAANAVAATGMTTVAGVGVDARAFTGPPYDAGWSWDDRPFGYAAPVTALSVDENALQVTIAPGASVGAPASVAFASQAAIDALGPATRVINRATTVASGKTTADAFWETGVGPVWPDALAGTFTIGIAGVIARNAGAEQTDVAVPQPLVFAANLLTHDLEQRRLEVERTARWEPASGAERVVWTHDSKPLGAMLADMWLPSDNLIAECWLRALARPAAERPVSAEEGATIEIAALHALGIDPNATMIVDGAGLSRENAISPRAMAIVLDHGWASANRTLLLNALPVAGVRGTLIHRFVGTPLQGRVFAKTGSMTNVSNVAGYLATEAHGPVTFAIFADDALIDDPPLLDLQRRILIALQDG